MGKQGRGNIMENGKEITKKEVVVVTGAGGVLCSAFAAAMA